MILTCIKCTKRSPLGGGKPKEDRPMILTCIKCTKSSPLGGGKPKEDRPMILTCIKCTKSSPLEGLGGGHKGQESHSAIATKGLGGKQ